MTEDRTTATQSLISTYRLREVFYERQIDRGNRAAIGRLKAVRDWLRVNDPEYIWDR